MSDINITSALSQIPAPEGTQNRGNDVVSTDASEQLVTLEKINGILMGYLTDVINPTVDDNGTLRKVPVQYGDAERWKTIRKDGVMRDPNTGMLLTPLIMLRRTEVRKGTLTNPNNKYMHRTFVSGWNAKNAYDRFAVLNGVQPSQKLLNVVVPDYMDLTYEGMLWTEYQSQMDTLIEKINVENDEFWGQRNNYKFRVSIDVFSSENQLSASEDRVVRTSFTMKVSAYLMPDRIIQNMKTASTTTTEFTRKKITFKENFVNKLPK